MTKAIHKMKISEFMFDINLQKKREHKFTEEHEYNLKQFVIAKNKHCKCIGKGKRCDACVSRIRDFELKEEDWA